MMAGLRDKDRFSDADLLQMLHLRDHDGMTCVEIAARFGVTKGRIVGALHRINVDYQASLGAEAEKPENMDGSQGAKWWRRGLSCRVAA